MVRFRKGYGGAFAVYVTLMKGVNDDPQSLGRLRDMLKRLAPTRVVLETFTDERFGKVWGIPEERVEDLRRALLGEG